MNAMVSCLPAGAGDGASPPDEGAEGLHPTKMARAVTSANAKDRFMSGSWFGREICRTGASRREFFHKRLARQHQQQQTARKDAGQFAWLIGKLKPISQNRQCC